jgi:hypothetical protein
MINSDLSFIQTTQNVKHMTATSSGCREESHNFGQIKTVLKLSANYIGTRNHNPELIISNTNFNINFNINFTISLLQYFTSRI